MPVVTMTAPRIVVPGPRAALIALAGFGLGVFVSKGLAEFGTAGTHDAPETAAAWSALAHRIGQGLRYGVTPQPQGDAGVPILR